MIESVAASDLVPKEINLLYLVMGILNIAAKDGKWVHLLHDYLPRFAMPSRHRGRIASSSTWINRLALVTPSTTSFIHCSVLLRVQGLLYSYYTPPGTCRFTSLYFQ